MDMSGLQETCSSSQMRGNYEEQGESTENELWEDDINPLGLLDLVYVENEEETNEAPIIDNQAPSISMKTNVLEEQKHESDTDSADSDEGEELEPVAAVDVLPGREEDFFPEGMTQEVMEPSRNSWTASRISNADPADQQRESRLEYGESILQRVLEVPGQIWPVGSHSTPPFTWKLAQQVNGSENNVLESYQHSQPSFRATSVQLSPTESRRHYFQNYRQRYPDLIRDRNREYARRYRQANAERVRERQRAYIKRYRERKKLEREQLGRLANREEEEAEIITKTDGNGLHAILRTRDNSKKEGVTHNMPPAMKAKNSEHVLDTNENDEIVLLT